MSNTKVKENEDFLNEIAFHKEATSTAESEHALWLDTLASVGLLCDQPHLADSSSCPRPKPINGGLYLTVAESAQLRLAVDSLVSQAAERCRQLTRLLTDLESQRDRSAILDKAVRSLGLRRPAELNAALSDLLAISDAYAAAVPVLDAAKAAVFDELPADYAYSHNNNEQQRHSDAALLEELEHRRRQRRRQQQRQRQRRRRHGSEDGRRRESSIDIASATEFASSDDIRKERHNRGSASSVPSSIKSSITPTEAEQFVLHFARLFDTPLALPACQARLSLLHRRVSESDSLMGNLRDALRLPSGATSRAVAAAVERLATARDAEARDCLASLLGPDELSSLSSRLAEYDRFFGQFSGLVGELRAELGVTRMSHILPAVRACARAARAAGWDGGGGAGSAKTDQNFFQK